MDFRPARMSAAITPEGSSGITSAAVEPETPAVVAAWIADVEHLSRPEGTRHTYVAGWRRFVAWCDREGHIALPAHPVTVAAYLVDAADARPETGKRAYAAATFRPGSPRSATSIAPLVICPRQRTSWSPRPCPDPPPATALRTGGHRCWSTTSRSAAPSRARRILVATARHRCRGWADDVLERCDSATPRLLLLGFAGAPTAAANSPTCSVATSTYTASTDCTSACESPKPAKRAGSGQSPAVQRQ